MCTEKQRSWHWLRLAGDGVCVQGVGVDVSAWGHMKVGRKFGEAG